MEINKMIWNSETGYIKYQESVCNLKSLTGLKKFDYLVRPELSMYCTEILSYLTNTIISKQGINGKLLDNIKIILDIWEEGSNMIIDKNTLNLAEKVGVSEYENYDQELFVFSWTNILTSLRTRILIQYAPLLEEPLNIDCPCECTKGENQNYWDNYRSGIWPKDEESVTIPDKGKDKICTCNYRVE